MTFSKGEKEDKPDFPLPNHRAFYPYRDCRHLDPLVSHTLFANQRDCTHKRDVLAEKYLDFFTRNRKTNLLTSKIGQKMCKIGEWLRNRFYHEVLWWSSVRSNTTAQTRTPNLSKLPVVNEDDNKNMRLLQSTRKFSLVTQSSLENERLRDTLDKAPCC